MLHAEKIKLRINLRYEYHQELALEFADDAFGTLRTMQTQVGQITLYNNHAVLCCHRVRIALAEAMAEYTLYNVDLDAKPRWYTEKLNATGKLPALTYGGPQTRPDEPSPDAVKLTESSVMVEFVADLFPAARLLPADPTLRARARQFVHHFDARVSTPLLGFLAVGQSTAACLAALEGLQTLLPDDAGGPSGFALGGCRPSIADAAVAPFLVTGVVLLEHDIGEYSSDEGRKALDAIRGPRFARLRRYIECLRAWPAFQATFDEATTLAAWSKAPRVRKRT